MTNNVTELSVAKLRRHCDPKTLKFKSTKELPELQGVIGQKRALGALTFGVNIKDNGYHIYAVGPASTGKTTIIRKFLEQEAKNKPVPCDWLYVNNFDDHDKPQVLQIPAGKGKEFKDDMDQFVEELQTEVPQAFEGKEYEKEQERIEQEFQQRSKVLFEKLAEKAEKRGFKLIQTAQGIAAFPIIDDKVVTPDQEMTISDEEREKIEKHQAKLQEEMRNTLRQIEQLQKKGKELIKELDQRIVSFVIDRFINELKEKYHKHKAVIELLKEARSSLLKNTQTFKQMRQTEQDPKMKGSPFAAQEPTFDEYRVNLVIDNSKTKGVPVIFEKNPIGPNLIGRIEQQGWFGTLVTNFSMIKSGSLHRANGGYLIIEALSLLTKPYAWHILKRALKNEEVMIESMGEFFGAFMTRTLEPEPIPLSIKVILIGDPSLFYLLYNLDPEFKELFKVKSDFEPHMEWNQPTVEQYAQFIATVCREEDLSHFAPSGVAKVVEHGARLVTHQQKLSTRFGDIVDLLRQASYWAKQSKHTLVQAEDVNKALEEKIYRSNRISEQLDEMMQEGTILIDLKDKVVGQINGLAVMSLEDYSFGKPSRITARTFVGSGGMVNIDREVKLGGPIHNKATMILAGYFGGKYAAKEQVSFSATITFEQTYDGVEGDSASCAEMYALLSSLADIPLRQDIAVTGSVNQHGDVQPIGGANEKIEGFFGICKLLGLTGTQGVIIPHQNVKHLMLHEEVVAAVKAGKFHIYPVSNIEEGIEILTGKSIKTIDTAVKKKLKLLTDAAQENGKSKKKAKKTKPKKKTK